MNLTKKGDTIKAYLRQARPDTAVTLHHKREILESHSPALINLSLFYRGIEI